MICNIFASDAHVLETNFYRFYFYGGRCVKFTVVIFLVALKYLLSSYLVFKGMKKVMGSCFML